MEVQKDIADGRKEPCRALQISYGYGLRLTARINEKGVKERISFFHTLSLCYLEDENLYVFIW